jgi:hypothetical protein
MANRLRPQGLLPGFDVRKIGKRGSTKANADVMVIDHVEKPSAN